MKNWLLLIKVILVVMLVAQCVSSRPPGENPDVISKDGKYKDRPGHHSEAPGPMPSDSFTLDSIKNSKAKKKKPG